MENGNENGCGHEGWMEASFDVVVATLAFGVPFGYYNTEIGWTCIIKIMSET